MKLLLLTTTVLLAASTSFAMSRPLPQDIKDQSLSEVSVSSSFSLRALDGGLVTLTSSDDQALAGLKNLPPEKNADHRKCGGTGDINLIIALSNVAMRTINNPTLSAADIKLLQSVPRCEPYLKILGSFGSTMKPQVDQDLPTKMSIVKSGKAYALQLTTAAGRQIQFQISSAAISSVTSVKDLSLLRLDAASTGQNAGIQFSVSEPDVSAPTNTSNVESCSDYRTVNRCDDKGCRPETIVVFGHRQVSSSTTTTFYRATMQIVDANSRVLLSAGLSDVNFDTQNDNGMCYPDPGQDLHDDQGPRGPRPGGPRPDGPRPDGGGQRPQRP